MQVVPTHNNQPRCVYCTRSYITVHCTKPHMDRWAHMTFHLAAQMSLRPSQLPDKPVTTNQPKQVCDYYVALTLQPYELSLTAHAQAQSRDLLETTRGAAHACEGGQDLWKGGMQRTTPEDGGRMHNPVRHCVTLWASRMWHYD